MWASLLQTELAILERLLLWPQCDIYSKQVDNMHNHDHDSIHNHDDDSNYRSSANGR